MSQEASYSAMDFRPSNMSSMCFHLACRNVDCEGEPDLFFLCPMSWDICECMVSGGLISCVHKKLYTAWNNKSDPALVAR